MKNKAKTGVSKVSTRDTTFYNSILTKALKALASISD